VVRGWAVWETFIQKNRLDRTFVTGNLTTDLSCICGSFVIDRHIAFTYKGKAANLKQIGCELNVHYVLEGSVQRADDRLRINVQLVDAETGGHVASRSLSVRGPSLSAWSSITRTPEEIALYERCKDRKDQRDI
jgi:hypothetical protein